MLQRLLLVFTIVSSFALSAASKAEASTARSVALASSPYELVNAVNALRVSYGLPPYSISPILMAAAQGHADYMAATGNVSHTGLGGSSVTERLLAAGYPLAGDLSLGGFRSENITSGNEAKSSQDAVNGWTGDAPHLNTMISPNLTEIGAGVSINGGRVYYVIDCALPTTNGLPQQPVGTTIAGGSPGAPGAGVIIPVVVATPDPHGDVIHEVKAGQSLWQIAISYATKIDEIKRLNNLYDNDIFPGMRLLIRQGVVLSPTVYLPTVTLEIVSSPTSLPTLTRVYPTTTAALTTSEPASTNTILGSVIGIIALAILGGGLFVLLGSSKQSDS